MTSVLRVVVAPDSFKGSLTAEEVAHTIREGWLSLRPQDDVDVRPQADGGEGTLDAVEGAIDGAVRHRVPDVTGPDGRVVTGEWLGLPDGTAVIELAQMSGLPLLDQLDALNTTSRGLGEVMGAAIDAGASRLLIGLGGSASTDGGLPVLEALGSRRPPAGGAIILADVAAPLLGPTGAASVFGPQKGASRADVALLEERLRIVATQLGADAHEPGTGAAGGVAYALRYWGASLVAGSQFVAERTGLPRAVEGADIVLTGEGRYDGQSHTGKVVGNVLALAEAAGARSGIIAGSADEVPPCWITTLRGHAGSTRAALASPEKWLRAAARLAAHDLPKTA